MKLEPNDKVQCVFEAGSLTYGKIYTVKEVIAGRARLVGHDTYARLELNLVSIDYVNWANYVSQGTTKPKLVLLKGE